ncbi:MAG: hypothetical protein CM15mP74_04410 [Halieaceae bacterium]|nr:MAG: hypothetical protein CM15mP74_04410 [Halieaceae bacterium]
MVNLLGRAPADELLEAADVSLHWYNKSIRSRRKVGHLNIQSADRQQLQKRLVELESALYPDGSLSKSAGQSAHAAIRPVSVADDRI